jgi:hypothetical protein
MRLSGGRADATGHESAPAVILSDRDCRIARELPDKRHGLCD